MRNKMPPEARRSLHIHSPNSILVDGPKAELRGKVENAFTVPDIGTTFRGPEGGTTDGPTGPLMAGLSFGVSFLGRFISKVGLLKGPGRRGLC